MQSDDKIIIAGNSVSDGFSYFKISRFNNDGSIDNTFNNTGSVLTYPGGAYARISNIAIKGNNLYAAGYGIFPGRTGIITKYRLCNAPEILPLKIINFTGKLQNNITALNWEVENQQKLSYFIVEKSSDSIHFNSIEKVAAKHNSIVTAAYATTDNNPFNGTNFYRLKLKNTDSTFSYSHLINVEMVNFNHLLNISPNPAKNTLKLTSNGNYQQAILQIIDNNGLKIKEIKATLNGTTTINIEALPIGIYNLKILTKTGIRILKFVKV